ncbi:MAG: sigma-70 family RNA polymerase sigma factor [Clostridia bacterium]|nr:sigma-70 family RNA polymerase sigma factor [Clostridia bacterium]
MQPMEEVYKQYANTVYRYLLSLTRSADTAEELTQETFYQAIRTSERYDGSCLVSTWLCGIAKKVWYSHLRKHPQTEPLESVDAKARSAEDEAVSNIGRMELMRALHELPEPAREVAYLRVFGGLSFKQIGEILGFSETRARVTYFRAKETLRKESDEYER